MRACVRACVCVPVFACVFVLCRSPPHALHVPCMHQFFIHAAVPSTEPVRCWRAFASGGATQRTYACNYYGAVAVGFHGVSNPHCHRGRAAKDEQACVRVGCLSTYAQGLCAPHVLARGTVVRNQALEVVVGRIAVRIHGCVVQPCLILSIAHCTLFRRRQPAWFGNEPARTCRALLTSHVPTAVAGATATTHTASTTLPMSCLVFAVGVSLPLLRSVLS